MTKMTEETGFDAFDVALTWKGNTESLNAENVTSPSQSVRTIVPTKRETWSHFVPLRLLVFSTWVASAACTALIPARISFHPFISHNIPIGSAINPDAANSPIRSAFC